MFCLSTLIVTGRSSETLEGSGKCDVGSGRHNEIYLLFRLKLLTKFAFALSVKFTCRFSLVFARYYKKITNKGRFCSCHRAQTVSSRIFTEEADSVKNFRCGQLLCTPDKQWPADWLFRFYLYSRVCLRALSSRDLKPRPTYFYIRLSSGYWPFSRNVTIPTDFMDAQTLISFIFTTLLCHVR